MITQRQGRSLALALPEATEADHHGMNSFRVRFATVPDDQHIRVMLEEAKIRATVAENPTMCKSSTGRSGSHASRLTSARHPASRSTSYSPTSLSSPSSRGADLKALARAESPWSHRRSVGPHRVRQCLCLWRGSEVAAAGGSAGRRLRRAQYLTAPAGLRDVEGLSDGWRRWRDAVRSGYHAALCSLGLRLRHGAHRRYAAPYDTNYGHDG